MYKYKSDKPIRPSAVDGFLSNTPRRPKIALSQAKASGPIISPQQNLMDDFNKPDGFRGRTVPKLDQRGDYSKGMVVSDRPRLSSATMQPSKPTALKHPKKKRSRPLKMFLRTSLIIFVIILGTTGFIFGKAWWSAHKVFQGGGSALAFQKNIDPHLLNGEGDGRVNILLLGKGGANHNGGELTDSMMIASLDPINNGVTLLSIPRDLWVNPSGLWPMKINTVYTSAKNKALNSNPKDKKSAEAAGLAKACATVEQYLGVHMHYYGLIEFTAFEEAVNTLGGINVNLPEPYYDGSMLIGTRYLNLPAGQQTLDGGIALGYARSRYGSARGDFDRGEHQQIVLVGIKDKILSLGTYANPIKISQLLSTFGNRVQTNLSIDDIMRIYNFSKQLGQDAITHVDMAQTKDGVVKTGTVNDLSVVIPKAGTNDFTKVKYFVRNNLKDGYIIKENPTIIVLNGSEQVGAAQKRADELKGYGYNVIKVADAPVKNLTETKLIDNTLGQKKYTLRYLEQRLNITGVNQASGMDLSAYTADFIIIIGSQG